MLSRSILGRWWTAVAAAVLMLSAGLAGCSPASSTPDLSTISDFALIPGDPRGPASQSIVQTDGSTWRFDHPDQGRVTLLYFGYTSCPDVCPTTMADLASAMARLPESVRSKVSVQFVSTDPARDTATQMRGWLDGFDPSFRGGRGPIDEVIAAAQVYGIGIEAPTVVDGDYQVTHGSKVLVLDGSGRAVGYFRGLAGAQSYLAAIPLLVQKYA